MKLPILSIAATVCFLLAIFAPDPAPLLMWVYGHTLKSISDRQWFTLYFGLFAAGGWAYNVTRWWRQSREKKYQDEVRRRGRGE